MAQTGTDLSRHGPKPFHKTECPSFFNVCTRTDAEFGYIRFSGLSACIFDFSVSEGKATVQLTTPVSPPANKSAADCSICNENFSTKYAFTAKNNPYEGTFLINVYVKP